MVSGQPGLVGLGSDSMWFIDLLLPETLMEPGSKPCDQGCGSYRDMSYDTEPSLKEFIILLGHNTHRRHNKGIIQDFIMKGKIQGPKYIFQIYL